VILIAAVNLPHYQQLYSTPSLTCKAEKSKHNNTSTIMLKLLTPTSRTIM